MSLQKQFILSALLYLALLFWFSLPAPLFTDPVCNLLYASDSTLLGARIATDGQWRFPEESNIPQKFEQCIVNFEDKRFGLHPGVDPLAISRAFYYNFKNARITSGGSTLTMQLVRLHRKGKSRTISEKLLEAILAMRIEMAMSKKEILAMYASHAPFGGNVVGLQAASWRYFGRDATRLSWAESAVLAVLPNAPSLIRPGRNAAQLKKKRDRLLQTLHQRQIIDKETYLLALDEELPGHPKRLPDEAPHLLERYRKQKRKGAVYATLDADLQRQITAVVNQYANVYQYNYLHNIAVIVAEVETGDIKAYVGNVTLPDNGSNGRKVDMITAERSPGSLLKPLLYGAMLQDGMILPHTLIPDIPLYINGFAPQNYSKGFSGAVPAHQAIAKSLNVPLVKMLIDYNYSRFHTLLKTMGITTLKYPADHYGASLILGGMEATLWDMAGIYASCARVLNHTSDRHSRKGYGKTHGDYYKEDFRPLSLNRYESSEQTPEPYPVLRRSAIWYTFEAMKNVTRPEEEVDWTNFESMKTIAWKTGTSYGGKDAWALGVTPRHVVGVWVGNASGEGRAGVTGVGFAAPILFDIYSFLPAAGWFSRPDSELTEVNVCRKSGYKASQYCDDTEPLRVPKEGLRTDVCPFHRRVYLDAQKKYQVTADCVSPDELYPCNWFVLPPAQEWYFQRTNADYEPLPPFSPLCDQQPDGRIDFIYPTSDMVIMLPKGFRSEREKMVLRAAHSRPAARLFWHLGSDYLGETQGNHQLAVSPKPGNYILTLVDEAGFSRKIRFTIVGSEQ